MEKCKAKDQGAPRTSRNSGNQGNACKKEVGPSGAHLRDEGQGHQDKRMVPPLKRPLGGASFLCGLLPGHAKNIRRTRLRSGLQISWPVLFER